MQRSRWREPGGDHCECGGNVQARHRQSSLVQTKERGVLYCCGQRLHWEDLKGTTIVQVICKKCGTTYAMDPKIDPNDDLPPVEPEEGDPGI